MKSGPPADRHGPWSKADRIDHNVAVATTEEVNP